MDNKGIHNGWFVAAGLFIFWVVLYADPGGKKACLEDANYLSAASNVVFTCEGRLSPALTTSGPAACAEFAQFMARLKAAEASQPFYGRYGYLYDMLFHRPAGINTRVSCDNKRPVEEVF